MIERLKGSVPSTPARYAEGKAATAVAVISVTALLCQETPATECQQGREAVGAPRPAAMAAVGAIAVAGISRFSSAQQNV